MSETMPTETTMTMPALGEGVDEATITRWLKQPGDYVEDAEPLLEAATDKVDTEIPSPCAGVLERILAEEDDTVAIGAPLAVISSEPASGGSATNGDAAGTTRVPDTDRTATETHQTYSPAGEPAAPTPPQPPPVDAVSLPRADFAEQAPSPAPVRTAPAADTLPRTEKLPGIRRTIARRMLESLQVSAQLTTVVEADITAIARLRATHKDAFLQRTGTKLTYLPFFARAAVTALARHPVLNASLNREATEITYYDTVHLGVAVDGPKGLMVPVIKDVGEATVRQLATSIAQAADRVRNATISVDELNGGTFTITSTGSRGALFDTPIINQPQTGILGVGAAVERLVPVREPHEGLRVDVRSMVYLSLTYDHRIVDGADAARFLGDVKNHLETGFDEHDLADS